MSVVISVGRINGSSAATLFLNFCVKLFNMGLGGRELLVSVVGFNISGFLASQSHVPWITISVCASCLFFDIVVM